MCDLRSLKTLVQRVQALPPLSLHLGSAANNVVCDSGLDSRRVFRVDGGGNSYIPSIERQTP